jgi:hypothetical protein
MISKYGYRLVILDSEKTKRLRYIRALEKFATRTIALLKKEDFECDSFKKAIKRYFESLKDIEEVRLDSTYLIKLQEYARMITDAFEVEDCEQIRENLLKEANLLHKQKTKSSYKKTKHKHKDFNDGY